MGTMGKVAYKPVGLLLGAAAGAIAGVVFKQVWKRVDGGDDAPHATDPDRTWGDHASRIEDTGHPAMDPSSPAPPDRRGRDHRPPRPVRRGA